ncbi:MAG: hypothetical protein WDA00_03380 [Eubacteriales bacterium]
MNGHVELLNFVYQNSQMGVTTIKQLIGIAEDESFKKHLESQLQGYEEIHRAAQTALDAHGHDAKGLSRLEKIKTYLMLNLQTLTDRTPSHLAEMLIVGSNMGIIHAVRKLRQYQEAEPEIRALMEELLRFEENNAQQLKAFL